MMNFDSSSINFKKMSGLVPVCVQDAKTLLVLMMGFMNEEALRTTLATKRVTFYSRTKARLWTKGETTGHYLEVVSMTTDCDNDSLLILTNPHGPTCHLGSLSCFPIEDAPQSLGYCLEALMQTLQSRQGVAGSYTEQLLSEGMFRIAQKVGEEGVEVALAAVSGRSDAIVNEVVDLLYHILVLLIASQIALSEVTVELKKRRKK
jgi:phosphoribosyl-ATP pyrophosphohydrolase/phosphoribosyl-AMP cyclohydrolase